MEEDRVLISQSEYDDMLDSINNDSNLVLGIVYGLLLGIVGAVIWAIVVKFTGYNMGIVAILVGWLVSEGFVLAGRSTSNLIGLIAGGIALQSIFLGEALSMIVIVAEYWNVPILEAVQNMYLTKLPQLIIESSNIYNLIFYFIAVRYAYRRSFINEANLNVMIEPDGIIHEFK